MRTLCVLVCLFMCLCVHACIKVVEELQLKDNVSVCEAAFYYTDNKAIQSHSRHRQVLFVVHMSSI